MLGCVHPQTCSDDMASFPLIRDLPPLLDSADWEWEPFEAPEGKKFWLGKDCHGKRWLSKLRGPWYGYREIVFARLAQAMGWSCQSSVFLRLDAQSAATLGRATGEVHAVHFFLEEHAPGSCSVDCPLDALVGRKFSSAKDLQGINVAHLRDWPKSQLAACLFGANEPPGSLITTAHEFVIIDAEHMFLTRPCDFSGANWWDLPDGSGKGLALEVCQDVCKLASMDVQEALAIPEVISLEQTWPIAPLLDASREFASNFCAAHGADEPD